jgi:hypothetical protein
MEGVQFSRFYFDYFLTFTYVPQVIFCPFCRDGDSITVLEE